VGDHPLDGGGWLLRRAPTPRVGQPVKFTAPGAPVPKARPRLGRRGRVYTPQKTVNFEARVQLYALRAGMRPATGPMYMQIDFYMENRRTRDLDNLAKAVLDALNGTAYADDNQVKELRVRKFLDRDNPRVNVECIPHPIRSGWA